MILRARGDNLLCASPSIIFNHVSIQIEAFCAENEKLNKVGTFFGKGTFLKRNIFLLGTFCDRNKILLLGRRFFSKEEEKKNTVSCMMRHFVMDKLIFSQKKQQSVTNRVL